MIAEAEAEAEESQSSPGESGPVSPPMAEKKAAAKTALQIVNELEEMKAKAIEEARAAALA